MTWRRGLLAGVCLLGAAPMAAQRAEAPSAAAMAPAVAQGSAAKAPGAAVQGKAAKAPATAQGAAGNAPAAAQGAAASKSPATAQGAAANAAPPAHPRFAWPRVQVIDTVEASEIVEAAGIPVALRAVHAKERLDALVQRFADAFIQAGLHLPPGHEQPQLANGAVMLTAVDMFRGITYTAIFQPRPDRTTMMYLGEANHALRRDPAAAGDFAPMPPQASQVLRVNSEGSRTLAFHVPLSGAEVDAFYADALKRAGWRLAEGETSFYVRAGEELRMVHDAGEANQRAVVLVYRGGQGVPPPQPAPAAVR